VTLVFLATGADQRFGVVIGKKPSSDGLPAGILNDQRQFEACSKRVLAPDSSSEMAGEKSFLRRRILRTIGLSNEGIEDIIERIVALHSPKAEKPEHVFPYSNFPTLPGGIEI
jgi:hypothetical protein